MAILHRNPMPLNGALFVTNPKRNRKGIVSRKMRNPLLRRRNATQVSLFPDADMPSGGSISTKSKRTSGATVSKVSLEKRPTIKARTESQLKYVQKYIEQQGGARTHASLDKMIEDAKKERAKKQAKSGGSKGSTGSKRSSRSKQSYRQEIKDLGGHGYSRDLTKDQLKRLLAKTKKDIKDGKTSKRSRSKTKWDKVKGYLKGSGLKMADVKTLYKKFSDGEKSDADLKKLAKAIDVYSRAQVPIGRTRRQKYIGEMKESDEYARLFNPFKKVQVRKNPILGVNVLATPLSYLQKAQNYVGTLPVVKHIAFAVTPMALMGGAYGAHMLVEPFVSKALNYYSKMDVPFISASAEFLAERPYATTGVVAGLVLALGAKYKLVDAKSATLVGGTLAGAGVLMDMMVKPVVEATQETIESIVVEDPALSGAHMAGMHMNGAHMGAIEMGGAHMSGMHMNGAHMSGMHMNGAHMAGMHMNGAHMGAIEMGGAHMAGMHLNGMHQNPHCMGAIELGYADASPADAYQCSPIMHPEEVQCAKAGLQAWKAKFGMSPKSLRGQRKLISRHAGRHGHRFGWCIKMLGFENFQKIASLPPKKREIVLSQLKQQAIASVPSLIQAQEAEYSAIESASVPVAGTFNGAHGSEGLGYGAMMFAGQGY